MNALEEVQHPHPDIFHRRDNNEENRARDQGVFDGHTAIGITEKPA